jgi:hypothetical protein
LQDISFDIKYHKDVGREGDNKSFGGTFVKTDENKINV